MSPSAEPSRRTAAVAVVAAVAVGVDAAVSTVATAPIAIGAIVVATAALVVGAVRVFRTRSRPIALLLSLALVLIFAGLRSYVFALQLGTLHAPPHAALTYDVLWLTAAAVCAVFLSARARADELLRHLSARPRRLLAGSFVLLILVSAVLLTLPISVVDMHRVSIIDALFTATSAVCVTGLAVNDIGTTYTSFGQGVILLAMQLGGIGIMTIAALAISMMRERVGKESEYARAFDADSIAELRSMVRGVTFGTLFFEACGATLLWLRWSDGERDLGGFSAVWLAVFHAVSSFCNVGFSLFPDSLARFTTDASTQLVISALVVLGGLGFPVWRGLSAYAARRGLHLVKKDAPRPVHFTLGTRAALVVTGALLVVGAAGFLVLEGAAAFSTLSLPARALNALFCSVISRTAGFTTVGFNAMHDATLLFTMALMFIGGSPGSTAGGVKTTTVAVIAAALRGELRGTEARILGSAVDKDTIRRAVALVTISSAIIFASLFLMCLTEQLALNALAFEVVSAFTTTGLSTGVTPHLSPLGKIILILTMFAGRVGPLTLALAIGAERKQPLYRLPEETLPVG